MGGLLRVLFATASQSEPPSLSRTFCEQTLFEQFWIVKTLVDLLFAIASDAEETAILVHFERFKVSLQIGYYDLVTPGRGWVVRMFMFGIPLPVSLSLNFPLCCFDGTACDERWNFIVFNTYRQRHGIAR